MPRLAGDISYRLRGGGKPTQACNRTNNFLTNPQSKDHQGSSAIFDGISDLAFLVGDFDLGIANAWSIMFWVSPADLAPVTDQMLYNIATLNGDNTNAIEVLMEAGGNLVFQMFNSSGVLLKKRSIAALDTTTPGIDGFFFGADLWHQVGLTWNGSVMNVYRNGTLMNSSMANDSDIGGSQTNTSRSILFSSRANPLTTDKFEGLFHQAAHWNVALTTEQMRVLYNQGAGSRVNLKIGLDGYDAQDNVMSWYKFGADSEPSLPDQSGGGINVNLTTTISTDKLIRSAPEGSAYTTEGTGQISQAATLQGVGVSQTVAAWVRATSLPGNGITADVVRFTDGAGNNSQIALSLTTSGADSFWVYEVSDTTGAVINTVVGDTPVVVDAWYHVLGCKNGAFSIRFFVNGVDDVAAVVAGVAVTADVNRTTYVGYDGRGTNANFDGEISSIALWDVPVSENSVQSLYNSGWRDFDPRFNNPCYSEAAALQHWWLLGQGDIGSSSVGDSTVTDMLSTGYALTTRSGVGAEERNFLSISPNSITGVSADFDNVSGLGTAVAIPVGIANSFTVSMWMLPRNLTTDTQFPLYIGPTDPSSTSEVAWRIEGDLVNDPFVAELFSSTGTTIRRISYVGMLVADEWQNVTMTWDGTTLSIFHNGVLISGTVEATGAGSMTDASRFIELGGAANAPSGLEFDGRIGHVGIWNSELFPDEIVALASYANSLDLRYNSNDYQSAETLVHYYKLGEDKFTKGRDFVDTLRGTLVSPLTVEAGAVPVYGDAP